MDALLLEAGHIVHIAAEPRPVGDSVKAAIERAARVLPLDFRRAKAFWYGEALSVRADEMDLLRRRERELLFERLRRLEAERETIAARIAALETTRNAAVAIGRDNWNKVGPARTGASRMVPEQMATRRRA